MLGEQNVLSTAGYFKPVIYLQCNSIIKNIQYFYIFQFCYKPNHKSQIFSISV